MKKITLLFLFIYSFCNAQYYTKHYIAPSPWQYWSDANEIVVSTLSTTTVNVDLYKSNGVYITTLNVTAANPVSYRFIGTASSVSQNAINTNYTDRGLIVEATEPVLVNLRNIASDSPGTNNTNIKGNASLVSFGSEGIGTSFRLGYYRSSYVGLNTGNPIYSVMAIEDDTNIILNGSIIANLDEGESRLFIASMGSLLTSTKPIVANVGSYGDTPQACGGSGEDGTVDQIAPTNVLGTQYMVVRGSGTAGTGADHPEQTTIVATEPNTVVEVTHFNAEGIQIGATITYNLNVAGNFQTFHHGDTSTQYSSSFIQSNNPIVVYSGTAVDCETDVSTVLPIGGCAGSTDIVTRKFINYNNGDLPYFAYTIIESATEPVYLNGIDLEILTGIPRTAIGTTGFYMLRFNNVLIGNPTAITLTSALKLTTSIVQQGAGFSMSGFFSAFNDRPEPPAFLSMTEDCEVIIYTTEGLEPYQWFLNGEPIAGATENPYIAVETGYYSVQGTRLCGVTLPSQPTFVYVPEPFEPGYPSDLETCFGNGGSLGVFDLTEIYDEVLGDDLDPNGYEITFHLSMTDLENWWNLEWNPPYPSLTQYQAVSNPQTIYVKIQDFNSDCFKIRTFDLITIDCAFTPPAPVLLCDNDKDGSESVDLAQFISGILMGYEDHSVSFHTSETGANASNTTDVIDHSTPYSIPGGTTTTVWIRLQSNVDASDFQVGSFTITVNSVPDIDFIEGTMLQLCDDDTNGFAVFNLTTVGNTITATISGLTISYYTSQTDAEAGAGAIINPNAYINTSNPQIIWVRAVNANGCYGISWITLQVNPLPEFNEPDDLVVCDDNFDGTVVWDLTVQTPEILVDVLDEISYYTSQSYAQNGLPLNSIINPEAYTNTTNPQTIWVRVENEHGCFIVTSFDLIVNALPEITGPNDLIVCSEDTTTQWNLTVQNSVISTNANDEITFFLTENEAQTNTNPITNPTDFTNTSNPQTIWARVETENGCIGYTNIDLQVVLAPEINQPENYRLCDDDADGIQIFNLATKNNEILGGLNAAISYHTSLSNAEQNLAPITTLTNYQNTSNPQTIYVRVEIVGGCYSITQFDLIVEALPIIPPLTNYELCDDNGDGFMVFDLTTKDLEILDGSTADLTYHLSLSDAESGENAIAAADLSNFTNQEIHQQTIYVRLENEFGCYDVSQFNIIVRPLPEVFTLEPLYVCNDGVNPLLAPFMLTDRTNAASGGVLGTTVTYHESVADAENNVNALPSPYMGTNNQVVYVRVENQYGCVSYMTLTLMIVEAPVDPVLDPLEYCDPNSDGIGVFDLTSVVPLIENANISPVTISFHGTYDDAFYDANNLTINNDITSFVNTEWYNQTIYIRIEGVTECFTIAELDLIVHDLPQITDPEPLEMCDDDYDGFVGFDLTSKSLEILGNLNPMSHEVSFFVTPGDAHANTNEIVNVTGYINQTENEDTVWVRVDDLSTGCYDVTALTLLVNPLPVVSMPEVPEYRLCDADADGYVEFDLQTQIAGIINGQAGLTVTFHDTYEDAALDQNAYAYLHTNNEPFIETVFVRVTTEKGCYVITLMDLIADPLPTLTLPAEPVVSCEGDGDGYGMFNLEELVEDMLNGADPTEFEVNFYETYINAQEGQNPISPLSGYQNSTPFVQTIYVSVYNTVSGCLAIYPLTLTVEGAPQLPVDAMNRLPDIELCDDNFDGIAYFDFTEQTNYIMAAQPDTTNLVVTYHQTQQDAENGTLAIATPDHYLNISNPQTIWVRLENTETECFDTAWFDIIVNVPLFIPENLQLTVCDADSDGEVFFDLTSMNPAILANASNPNNYQVDFFLNLADAQGGINVIPNPTNFSNQELGGGGVYTIYVRVIDLVTGCESYRAMTIRRAPMPNPMTDNLVALELCDAVTEDDMMEEFDLTVYEAYIRNGDNNLIFTYHLSEVEEWNDENAIATPEAYFTGSTTIYIRIANQPNADQSCVTVIELDVVVNPLPTVAQNYFAICEENSTGYAQFDLNGFTPTLLGPDQNPAEFLVEYYLTLADAENQTNPINQGVPFENTTQGSETIYVHIYNTITECERVAALTLYAEEAAVANPVDDITLCDYDGTNDGVLEINLDDYWKDTVLGGQDPMQFAVTYHLSEADAQNDVNAIANPTAYSNTDSPYSQTIYIRVENTNTLSPCYDIAVAQILIEGLAEPVITSDYTHICVDYDTREVVRTVTLDSNVTDPNYTFEWYHNGTLIAGATGSTYTIEQFGGEGEYYVIATSTAPYFGCSSEPSAPMVIGLSGPATIVEILPTNAFADQQDIIVTVNGYGEYMYQLDNGPLQDTGHFVNVSPGAHVITVYDVLPGNGNVDDYNNCDAIPVENVSVVNYPHYFTPNGDGYHDRWNITGLNAYHNAEIYIFDRYGKLLKQLNPTGEGWDGTYNGTPLPASDYWFKVVYDEPVTDAEGNTTTRRKEFKAHFAIKR